jgi:hypothetical protein
MVLNGARPSAGGRIKQGAQLIASVLLSTQSKALGNSAGAGIIFDPVAVGAATVTTVSAADMMPMITGSCISGMPPGSLSASSASVQVVPDNADAGDLVHGYKIRFQKTGDAVQSPTAWMKFSNANTASFREDRGQTQQNTIWPTAGGPYSVLIARYPSKGEALLELPKGVVIDLRYSGITDGAFVDPNWGNLSGKKALALTFDSVGSIDALMQNVLGQSRAEPPFKPTTLIYFLVNTKEWVDSEPGRPLGNPLAMWVVVHPQTGRVSVSSNVPTDGTNGLALRAARQKAREGLAVGK